MRLFVFAFFALLALVPLLAFADANETLPPVPPTESMLIIKAVYPNGSAMANAPVILLSRPKDSPSNFSVFRLITDQWGAMLLSLGRGQYELDAISNLPSTAGADFASTSTVDASANSTSTMVFYPAGSITGAISYNGLPVADAEVSISCPSNSFDYGRINGVVAAKAGAFSVLALPVGRCAVSASSGALAASQELEVMHGQTNSARLELMPIAEKQPSQGSGLLAPALIAVFVLLVAAIAYALFGKSRKGKGMPNLSEEKTVRKRLAKKERLQSQKRASVWSAQALEDAAPRQRDASVQAVLSTLSEREREIAKYLLRSGGRAKRSAMQNKLLIPKTSLIRNLRSLERKNIVKLTPFGRNMVAELCGVLKP